MWAIRTVEAGCRYFSEACASRLADLTCALGDKRALGLGKDKPIMRRDGTPGKVCVGSTLTVSETGSTFSYNFALSSWVVLN